MKRETEIAVLLLAGVSTAIVAITGTYTRYVRPALLPWLIGAAVVLIALAVSAIVGDRRGRTHGDELPGGHGHRQGVGWLLMVPIVVLMFVVPPALAARGAAPTVAAVSTDVLRRPFAPLPAERAPTVSLPNLIARAANDTAGTLSNRLVTVVGFTFKDAGAMTPDLARVAITCCAADAQLARIHLSGALVGDAKALPEGSWLRVEGIVAGAAPRETGSWIPTLNVSALTRIEPPANPYAYNS
jgi:uncharacterized repeat protein (TIGR03943 family)